MFPFPKKSDLEITKNYTNTTLIAIAAKVYHALLLNYIKLEIEKKFRKNQNGFQRNQSTTSQFWLAVELSKEHVQKILRQYYCL